MPTSIQGTDSAEPSPATQGRGGRPWAVAPRLHVFLIFMTQFILIIMGFGAVVPLLHKRGVPVVGLVLASAAGLVALHFVIAVLGARIPVRCKECGSRSRYRGFGWWPFTYRYRCGQCGHEMRYEVVG